MEEIKIPQEQIHDSGTGAPFFGVVWSVVIAVVGGAALGAGYGAVIALCSEKYVNITLACAFPFWMNSPANMGFLWGHVRDAKWKRRIGLLGVAVCFYGIGVGWLASVLDGPGLVFNPIELFFQIADTENYSFWVAAVDLEQEVRTLPFYFLALRFGEMSWLLVGGLMCSGSISIYPYCQSCKHWMDDAVTLRLHYAPASREEARQLAEGAGNESYGRLMLLSQLIGPKEKGLEVSVYRCENCDERFAMDLQWYPATEDPEKDEVEKMLESASGIELVSSLIVPVEIFEHFSQLQKEIEPEVKKAA